MIGLKATERAGLVRVLVRGWDQSAEWVDKAEARLAAAAEKPGLTDEECLRLCAAKKAA